MKSIINSYRWYLYHTNIFSILMLYVHIYVLECNRRQNYNGNANDNDIIKLQIVNSVVTSHDIGGHKEY